jgi:hypothetical protein
LSPEKSENGDLVLIVGSQTSRSLLNTARKEIIDLLKATLNIDKLRLDIQVTESTEEKLPYFPEEIFEHFLNINPELSDLIKKLDLDFR